MRLRSSRIKIRCIHRGNGCEWVGELGALKDHLDSDKGCEYVEVKCTNIKSTYTSRKYRSFGTLLGTVSCEAAMERRHLSNHQENECVHRQYTCEHCGYTDTYDAIAGSGWKCKKGIFFGSGNHYDECADYPLDCPNECGEKNIKRSDMKTHQDSCPLEPLDCPFQYVGCSAGKIARGNMDSHCQENTQQHLLLVVQSHQQLAQSHQQLTQSHQQLASKNKQLEGKNDELDRKNSEALSKIWLLECKNVQLSNDLDDTSQSLSRKVCRLSESLRVRGGRRPLS